MTRENQHASRQDACARPSARALVCVFGADHRTNDVSGLSNHRMSIVSTITLPWRARGGGGSVLICLLGLGCRYPMPARPPGAAGPPVEKRANPVATSPDDCGAAVKAFLEKRFAELRGLPGACPVGDVATQLGAEARPDSSGWLGERAQQASFRMAAAPGYSEPIRVWHDRGALLMLDAQYPEPPGGWQRLSAALGPPEAKLDYRWGVVTVVGGEWVYASRGLTVFLTPALDTVIRLLAFTPKPLPAYRQAMRPVSREEEWPVPKESGP
jgi:hypothetical protein